MWAGESWIFRKGKGDFLNLGGGGVDQKGVVKNYGGGDGLGPWHG